MKTLLLSGCLIATALSIAQPAAASDPAPLRERLKPLPFKIAFETYAKDNWEIFVMNADGSDPANLTNTPKEREMYPQISPDGSKICFETDAGEGRTTIRSIYVMGIDGKNRRKVADYARQPCWAPDSKTIAYLPQEFPKFNVVDYYSKGLSYYNATTGKSQPHPNSDHLHHLYNPSYAPNGKWIIATVHAGMGFDHAILLIETQGSKIINLKIPGCRPCFSPDGKQVAWGAGDYEIAVANINLDSDEPAVSEKRLSILDQKLKIYHVDWSPDSRFLSFSRGPDGHGDISYPGTYQAACEMVGIYATGWNLCAVSAERDGKLDLNQATEADLAILTTNGFSNKESAWFKAPKKAKE